MATDLDILLGKGARAPIHSSDAVFLSPAGPLKCQECR